MTDPSTSQRRRDPSAPGPLARYLVPMNFTPCSLRALERAIRLAAAARGQIHLLHVAAPGEPDAAGRRARRALAHAMLVARKEARRSGHRGVQITSSLRSGSPHVEIIRCARELGAEVVVMGRAGPEALRRRTIGTTTARVVRMSDIPTLVVGRRRQGPYRRPLVAVEIDPSARDIIGLTRRIVGSSEIALRIIHAYRMPFEGYYLANRDRSAAAYFREARKAAAESVAKLLDAIGSRESPLRTALRRGDARTVILKEAVRCRADLIVLGTHGRSGVSHFMLGSVAEWVIANTSRDVLVARPVRFTFVPP